MKHTLNVSLLILLSVLLSAPAAAQTDFFLKMTDINGESTVQGHEDEIDVLGWGWQISNAFIFDPAGGGGSSATPQIGDISIIKYTDAASPLLYSAILTGRHVDEAILTVRRSTAAGKVPYLVITMTDVVVTSARPGGGSGEGRLVEQITLIFAQLGISYTTLNADGTPGATIEIGWDVAANKEL